MTSSQVCTIGLDIAKNKFQVHGEDRHGKKVFNRQLLRKEVLPFFANLPACLIGIEACGGAHYWARELGKLGHEVRLIPPRQVRPFVINNKTDAADARAICEVVRRPNTNFVQVKTVNQQHLSAIHRVRERAIGNRTALVNQIRSLLHELGIIIPQGIQKFRKALPAILTFENSQIPHGMVTLFQSLYEELCLWDERIKTIEEQLHSIAKNNESCARLMKIPGVGVLTASAIVAHVGDARHFKNGRQFAASLGLMLMCHKVTQTRKQTVTPLFRRTQD